MYLTNPTGSDVLVQLTEGKLRPAEYEDSDTEMKITAKVFFFCVIIYLNITFYNCVPNCFLYFLFPCCRWYYPQARSTWVLMTKY